jgi:hypothetical protein
MEKLVTGDIGKLQSSIDKFMSERGLDPKNFEAEAQARDTVTKLETLRTMDAAIRQNILSAYGKDAVVERRADGWYVNGELKVRNPYAGR